MVAVRSGTQLARRPGLGNRRATALACVDHARRDNDAVRRTGRDRQISGTRARAASIFPAHWFDRLTLDEAYRIQLGLIDRRCAAGERQIGWKVGLTAKPIQQQFGFHEPVFGCILESRPSGHVFGRDDLIKPGFEPELCLRVGQPLPARSTWRTCAGRSTRCIPRWRSSRRAAIFAAQIAVAMADNAQQKTIILGDPVATWLDAVRTGRRRATATCVGSTG